MKNSPVVTAGPGSLIQKSTFWPAPQTRIPSKKIGLFRELLGKTFKVQAPTAMFFEEETICI